MLLWRDGEAALAAYLVSAPGMPPEPALLASIGDAPRAAARLGIYKNNVVVRLIEALEASYPIVKRLAGDAFFRFAAQSYLAVRPPRSALLQHYGARFPAFLSGFAPAASVPYLADVARLERLYMRAFHATDRTPVDVQSAAQAQGGLKLHPSAGLMTSPHPVSRIFALHRRDGEVEETELPWEQEWLLVSRPQRHVEIRRLSAAVYAMAKALGGGHSLASATSVARAADSGVGPDEALATLIRSGAFVARRSRRASAGSP
jgi:hypothetical protein